MHTIVKYKCEFQTYSAFELKYNAYKNQNVHSKRILKNQLAKCCFQDQEPS